MKKLLCAISILAAFTACSSPKKIVLTDGTVITTKNNPDYDKEENVYTYKDLSGDKEIVNKDLVKTIVPASTEVQVTAPKEGENKGTLIQNNLTTSSSNVTPNKEEPQKDNLPQATSVNNSTTANTENTK